MRFLQAVKQFLAPNAYRSGVSTADFRAEMLARLQRARPDATLAFDPDDDLAIMIMVDGVEEGRYNLHRLEDYCRRASAYDGEINKADYVAKMTKPTAKPTRDSLRLVVRDESYLAAIEEFGAANPDRGDVAKHRQIGDGLYAFLAADSEDKVSFVGDAILAALGLPPDDAWEIAAAQTRAILPALPVPAQIATGVLMFPDQDYLASLLIDLPSWAALSAQVGPDLFVTAVADNIVLVGTLGTGPALESLRKAVADDCAAQERGLSPHILRFRDGRWAIAE